MPVARTATLPHEHVLIRVPKTGKPLSIMAAQHKAIARAEGRVWIGIPNQRLCDWRRRWIAERMRSFHPVRLFLVRGAPAEFTGFGAAIVDASSTLPAHNLVPDYYFADRVIEQVGIWFLVWHLARVSTADLSRLRVANTGNFALEKWHGISSLLFVC